MIQKEDLPYSSTLTVILSSGRRVIVAVTDFVERSELADAVGRFGGFSTVGGGKRSRVGNYSVSPSTQRGRHPVFHEPQSSNGVRESPAAPCRLRPAPPAALPETASGILASEVANFKLCSLERAASDSVIAS